MSGALAPGQGCVGCDRGWRWRAAELLWVSADAQVLELRGGLLAGGSAVAVARQLGPRGRVVSCKLDNRRLAVAREWGTRPRSQAQIDGVVADAVAALPFADQRFDAAMVEFGLGDPSEAGQRARELFRVLVPGGRVVLLELALVEHPLFRLLYTGYLGLVFRPGGAGSGHARSPACAEILSYPARATVPDLLREAGFVGHTCERAAAGVVAIHAAYKPCR